MPATPPAITRRPESFIRLIQFAVRIDEELNKLLGGVSIASGGALPDIHQVLIPKKGGKEEGESQEYMELLRS